MYCCGSKKVVQVKLRCERILGNSRALTDKVFVFIQYEWAFVRNLSCFVAI